MTTEAATHSHDHDHDGHHVMPLPMLFGIFGALIFFTILTVAVGQFSLGRWEIIITMIIATIKATLVAVFFMHLMYDRPFNAMIFSFSLFFVALFLGIVLMDVGAYEEDLRPPEPAAAVAAAPASEAEAPESTEEKAADSEKTDEADAAPTEDDAVSAEGEESAEESKKPKGDDAA